MLPDPAGGDVVRAGVGVVVGGGLGLAVGFGLAVGVAVGFGFGTVIVTRRGDTVDRTRLRAPAPDPLAALNR
jgi:hypothetical protein